MSIGFILSTAILITKFYNIKVYIKMKVLEIIILCKLQLCSFDVKPLIAGSSLTEY